MTMTSEEQPETIDDQRRLTLITDPNYALVLSFLEKFRSTLDLPSYSFQRLEDHLLHTDQRIPPRLIDFHFILLKRLSLAKNTQREKFDSIITKFVSRFDLDDSEHLMTNGYLQTDIKIKIRILKNLLESQFDLNQTFKNTLVDRSARDLKCLPLGRDRFGVCYWFFMDADCFVRLFREDVDVDRNWTSVAKNRDELEDLIRLLITDSAVRKKFSDWTIDYEPLASSTPSNEFEERFLPTLINVKIEDEDEKETKEPVVEEDPVDVATKKKKRGRPRASTKVSAENSEPMEIEVKKDEDEEVSTKERRGRRSVASLKPVEVKEEPVLKDVEPTKPKRGRGRPSLKEVKQERAESVSYDDEPAEPLPKKQSRRPSRNARKAAVKVEVEEEEDEEDEEQTTRRGRKRKNPIDEPAIEETSSASVRRSARPRKAPALDSTPTIVAPSKSKKKRPTNSKTKGSAAEARSTRRRKAASKRNPDDRFCLSSSSSDEGDVYISDEDDDDDEFDQRSEDYPPDPSDFDLVEDQLFDVDEETNSAAEELRTAKTAHASTIVTACRVCEKSDRPEVLLLCDDCDDAYHIKCLRPALLAVPDGDWFCPLCEHKKLSDHLITKLKELLLQYQIVEQKRQERLAKRTSERKIRPKDYSSDESVTASESEEETLASGAIQSQEDESMLSASQINENSNLSSSNFEDASKNISQRGRHRRTRFDMTKMLNDPDESGENSDSHEEDDEYMENAPQIANFDLQLPKKMTRLLNYRYRPAAKMEAPASIKPRPIRPRPSSQTGLDINDNLDSPLNYVNGDGSTMRPIKSLANNSKQTLKIVRRWNDVQRRSRLKISNATTPSTMRNRQETTSDCADENSVFCPDDSSPPRSNESETNADLKDDDATIIRSKITLIQPGTLLPIQKSSTRNVLRKNEVTFDRLTRDIQYAVSEANTLSTVSKTIDQQQVKRVQRTNFSPYFNKVAVRPLPVLLPKPASIGYKIFKSKDPPPSSLPSSSSSSSHSTSTTTDLSNIMLTPSSSSSLMDNNDDPTGSTMNS